MKRYLGIQLDSPRSPMVEYENVFKALVDIFQRNKLIPAGSTKWWVLVDRLLPGRDFTSEILALTKIA